jgi:hypothetical protein
MIEIMCSWLEGLCICLNYSGWCEETEEERQQYTQCENTQCENTECKNTT